MKKNILITGAAGEIGGALADFYSKKDINLILASRNRDNLAVVKKKVSNQGASVLSSQFDYADVESYGNVLNCISQKLHGVVIVLPKIKQTTNCLPTKDEWLNLFTEVFINPLEFLKSLIPLLLAAKPSKVVIISGISSKVLLSNYAANGAIRSAWHAQVKAIASEYGSQRLHINTLSLGGVMTESFVKKVVKESIEKQQNFESIIHQKTSNVPLNKYASLDDVCNAVDGLLGSFTDHMTGGNFLCDGGFLKVY